MKNLITFENKKFWRGQKSIAVLMLFVVALVGMVMYNTAKDKSYWHNYERNILVEKNLIRNQVKSIEAQLESLQQSESEEIEIIDKLNDQYKLYRAQYLFNYRQEIMSKNYKKGEASAQDRIELWIERDQHLLAGLKAGHSFLDENITEVRQRMLVNKFLIEEEIEPLNSPYEMTATNFIYHLTDYPWMLIVLIAISFLCIGMFSGDIEGGAYKVLYSQPFRRDNIFGVKFFVHFVNSFFVITGLIGAMYVFLALLNGLGDMSYPIFYYGASYQNLSIVSSADIAVDSFTFLTWSTYLMKTLPLFCLLCCFSISLIGSASLLLNNTANVLNALFCWLVLDFISGTMFSSGSIFYMIWPFTAARLNSVLQGYYYLTAAGYIILLAGMSVVLLTASLIILKKRNMTGGIGL